MLVANVALEICISVDTFRTRRYGGDYLSLTGVALVVVRSYVYAGGALGNKLLAYGTVAVGICRAVRILTSENAAADIAYSVFVFVKVTGANVFYVTLVTFCVYVFINVTVASDLNVCKAECAVTVVISVDMLGAGNEVSTAVVTLSVGIEIKVLSTLGLLVDAEHRIYKPRIILYTGDNPGHVIAVSNHYSLGRRSLVLVRNDYWSSVLIVRSFTCRILNGDIILHYIGCAGEESGGEEIYSRIITKGGAVGVVNFKSVDDDVGRICGGITEVVVIPGVVEHIYCCRSGVNLVVFKDNVTVPESSVVFTKTEE